jgi:hypothetical protein
MFLGNPNNFTKENFSEAAEMAANRLKAATNPLVKNEQKKLEYVNKEIAAAYMILSEAIINAGKENMKYEECFQKTVAILESFVENAIRNVNTGKSEEVKL